MLYPMYSERNNHVYLNHFQVTSVTKVNNVYSATQLLAQTTLRNMLGTKTLQDILSDREAIANLMEAQLDEGSSPWGIKVERVEM